jgi:hypothetical protein
MNGGSMTGGAAAMSMVLVSLALVGCVRRATAAECNALLDRYVELLLKEQDPAVGTVEVAAKQEMARAKAANDQAFAACPREVGSRAIDCAMRAPNVDEFEKCLE